MARNSLKINRRYTMKKIINDTNVVLVMNRDLEMSKSPHNSVMAQVNGWRDDIYGKPAAPADSGTPDTDNRGSHLTMRDIQRTIEGSIPGLSSPFVDNTDIVGIQAKNAQSEPASEIIEGLINYQYNHSMDNIAFIEDMVRDLQVDGTTFVKSGWKDDMAFGELVMINELFVDPSARSLKDAKFVIQRTKVSMSDILNNPGWYGKHNMDELIGLAGSATNSEYDDEIVEGAGQDNSFNFDDARGMLDVMEYYGVLDVKGDGVLKPILGIWSGDKLLNFVDSPYPENWNGNPFSVGVYTRQSHNVYGLGVANLIADYQSVRTGFMREIINNAQKANSSQVASRKGSIDIANKRKMTMGADYEYVGTEPGIIHADFNDIPASVFNIVETFKVEQEELSGISRMNAGIDQNSLNTATATAVNVSQSNADKRLLQITRHVSSLLQDMFSKWIDLNQMMLQNGMVQMREGTAKSIGEMMKRNGVAVNGVHGKRGMVNLDVSKEMLQGDFNLVIQVGTSAQKTAQLGNINNMLVAMGQVQTPEDIKYGLLAEMAKILDMNGLAQDLNKLAQPDEEKAQAQAKQAQKQQTIQDQAIEQDMAATNASTQKDLAAAQKMRSESVENVIQSEILAVGA